MVQIANETQDTLEILVEKRTEELTRMDDTLLSEIKEGKESSQSLRITEEQFCMSFEFASIGMALVSLEDRFLQVNPLFCEIVGYPQGELIGTTFQAITHLENVATDLSHMKELVEGKLKFYEVEKKYIHKLGHIVWIFLSASLVRDTQGNPLHFVVHIQDITARKKIEEALQESEKRYRALIQNLPIGLFRTTPEPQGKFIMVNPAFTRMFGYRSMEEFLLLPVSKLYADPRDREMLSENLLSQGEAALADVRFKKKDGTLIRGAVSARVLRDQEGAITAFDGMIEDITSRKKAEEQIKETLYEKEVILKELSLLNEELERNRTVLYELAIRDELTGLYNRREIIRLLKEETERSHRYNHSFGLLLLDIDFFKNVNDTYGHVAGDHILKFVGDLLQKSFRSIDKPARYGGDELLVLLPETTQDDLLTAAEKIRVEIEEKPLPIPLSQEGVTHLTITISLGLALFPRDGATAESLISAADQSLYEAKKLGRNRVVCYCDIKPLS